jgi:dTDP-glucose pyrophosphorylase
MAGIKALVLAGGRGRRLDRRADAANKCMLPLLGKPLVQYSLESAVRAGVETIVLVVGHRAEDIINHFGNDFAGTPIQYVIQAERKGLVHAMACARDAIDRSDFMLLLADEVLARPKHEEMLRRFHDENLFALCGVVRALDREQIRKTYALFADETTGRIFRLVEKPRVPINDIMGTGNCVMRSAIFDYVERTPIHAVRGERELPDLIQCAVDDGRLVKLFDFGGGYLNVNTPEDIAAAEAEAARWSGPGP